MHTVNNHGILYKRPLQRTNVTDTWQCVLSEVGLYIFSENIPMFFNWFSSNSHSDCFNLKHFTWTSYIWLWLRYGWIPALDDITEELRTKYSWVPDTSITFMEVLHGAYRWASNHTVLQYIRFSRGLFLVHFWIFQIV